MSLRTIVFAVLCTVLLPGMWAARECRAADEAFTIKLGGRIQADAAFYADDASDLGNGTEIRRARLSASGTVRDAWYYKLEYDFAGSGAIKDAFIRYDGWDGRYLMIGQIWQFVGLEGFTSSKYITFMERSLPINTLTPDRALGVSMNHYGESWNLGYGVFGDNAADHKAGDESWSISSRLNVAPRHEPGDVLQFGASLLYREPDDTRTLSFSAEPDTHIADDPLVDTGDITGVRHHTIAGLEASWVAGPWSVQGEYVRVEIERETAAALAFDGWYAFVSWFPTGESRPYSVKYAAYDKLKPLAASGAWELALRLAEVNLDSADVAGGVLRTATLGINWYPDQYLRFMLNLIRADSERQGVADDPLVLQLRAQIAW